jgi:hypothetical protein
MSKRNDCTTIGRCLLAQLAPLPLRANRSRRRDTILLPPRIPRSSHDAGAAARVRATAIGQPQSLGRCAAARPLSSRMSRTGSEMRGCRHRRSGVSDRHVRRDRFDLGRPRRARQRNGDGPLAWRCRHRTSPLPRIAIAALAGDRACGWPLPNKSDTRRLAGGGRGTDESCVAKAVVWSQGSQPRTQPGATCARRRGIARPKMHAVRPRQPAEC